MPAQGRLDLGQALEGDRVVRRLVSGSRAEDLQGALRWRERFELPAMFVDLCEVIRSEQGECMRLPRTLAKPARPLQRVPGRVVVSQRVQSLAEEGQREGQAP